LTAEDERALLVEPHTVLPRLLAEAETRAMERALQLMHRQLPQVLENVRQQQAQVSKAQEAFFGAWPELNDAKYHSVVLRHVNAYRQLNPTAAPEDVIKEAGISALIALRLPLPERVLAAHNPTATNALPGGFQPAPASGGATALPRSAAPTSTNEFELLATDIMRNGVD
jgi:hypothetical protein